MNNCLKCGARCEKEYCWRCKPRKPLKRGKMGAKTSNILHNAENKHQMRDFFLGIWNKRFPHECFICKKNLGNEPRSYMFDHALEKAVEKYKHLMYNEDNIFYLCFECHDEKTRGFIPDIYKKEIEKLKTKYEKTEQ